MFLCRFGFLHTTQFILSINLHSRLLLTSSPGPLLIFFPLALGIPKAPPAFALATNAVVQTQKCIRIALTQNFFALPCILAFAVSSFTRDLTSPLRVLYWLQRRKGDDDAERKQQDGGEEFERDVEWEGS